MVTSMCKALECYVTAGCNEKTKKEIEESPGRSCYRNLQGGP